MGRYKTRGVREIIGKIGDTKDSTLVLSLFGVSGIKWVLGFCVFVHYD